MAVGKSFRLWRPLFGSGDPDLADPFLAVETFIRQYRVMSGILKLAEEGKCTLWQL